MNYKKIGLRIGLEIHHELDTKEKLFCSCPTLLKIKEKPDFILERYQRSVAGETGEIDVAALEEMKKQKKIIYEVYDDCNCLVETDSEPPHEVNQEALEIALTIAELFHCEIVDEIQIMRKTIVDGSLPSGFQRTMLIGIGGWLNTNQGKVEIEAVTLEEDSARLMKKDRNSLTFRLDRLGTPEVEVGTGKGIVSPEHAKETARKIGDIIRSTGKAKIREGCVRQDVNISIKDGDRVEAKHVPSLSLIPIVIEKEIKRQKELIKSRKKVSRDVRRVLPDGSTKFLRSLPGAARMYPETDNIPIRIEKSFLAKIRKKLPETVEDKKIKFRKMNLSKELLDEISKSGYSELFERVVGKFAVEPRIIANVFVNTLKDLERNEKVDVNRLNEKDFMELFSLLEKNKIAKESIPNILKYRAEHDMKITDIVKKLGLEILSMKDLEKIIDDIIKKNKGKDKKIIIGIVMNKVRGKALAKDVIELIGKKL